MSTQSRALVMGLLGPLVSATGLLWLAVDSVADPRTGRFGIHHLMFNAPHLVIAAGVALSFIAIPMALRVAVARPGEVEIPVFDRDLVSKGDPAERKAEDEEFQAQPAPR
jgi:hypothetical protein